MLTIFKFWRNAKIILTQGFLKHFASDNFVPKWTNNCWPRVHLISLKYFKNWPVILTCDTYIFFLFVICIKWPYIERFIFYFQIWWRANDALETSHVVKWNKVIKNDQCSILVAGYPTIQSVWSVHICYFELILIVNQS